jgi:metal-dependent amidase/aminoacylase/carboxypeptidase family protein
MAACDKPIGWHTPWQNQPGSSAGLLEKTPGSFAFVGNGETSAPLHNPSYDFNDNVLRQGAEYFVAVARRRLR